MIYFSVPTTFRSEHGSPCCLNTTGGNQKQAGVIGTFVPETGMLPALYCLVATPTYVPNMGDIDQVLGSRQCGHQQDILGSRSKTETR